MNSIPARLLAVALMLLPASSAAAAGTLTGGTPITHVAGRWVTGYGGDGGLATDAYLDQPLDLAIDAAGNIYVADGSRVRRIDVWTGVITTIVGGPNVCADGGDGGPARTAWLCQPQGLAFDSKGNLYISDDRASRVRKIDMATGIITAYAGSGVRGSGGDGGPATQATMFAPAGIAFDANDNLYIADWVNNNVRKVTAQGIISTVAGTGVRGYSGDGGPALGAQLDSPNGVGVDRNGNLLIADTDNCRVRRVDTATGLITTRVGNGCIDYRSLYPMRLAVDRDGTLFIADLNNRVLSVAPGSGNFSMVAGSGNFSGSGGDGGRAWATYLRNVLSVALDGSGNLYLIDNGTFVIRKVARDDVPLTGDIDGDGRTELIVWRPGTGTWYWLASSTNWDAGSGGGHSLQWGNEALGDMPFTGDFDGDGRTDLAIWRASTGTWYWLTSSTGYSYATARSKQWGNGALGDVPMVADMDGDGRADLVIWRPSVGMWFWLTSSSGYAYSDAGYREFGNQALGDVPFARDIDGDGQSDLVVWRASTGTWQWIGTRSGYDQVQWGNAAMGDVPVLADMDGDGRADLVIMRWSTQQWLWLTSSSGYSVGQQRVAPTYSGPDDLPAVADFDGDGRPDLGTWDPSSGYWSWVMSGNGWARQWGA